MNILIVAAHSDDEVLGAGASIARWTREGHKVSGLFFTDGVGSRGRKSSEVKARQAAARAAAKILGLSIVEFGTFPDNELDIVPLLELAQTIERAKKKVQPEAVYTHFWGDLNIDHRRVFEATLTAFRPQPGEVCRSIHCFEVASATEWGSPATPFRPTTYNEVSDQDVETAVRAYQCYTREVRADPHARSVEAFLARRALRGRETGVTWAEAFTPCRQLTPL
jgi:LmbE family N-acetylglucosaminyl deacetylase